MKPGLMSLAVAGLAASSAQGAPPAPAPQRPGCSTAAVTAAGADVRAARAELRAIPLGDPDTLVAPATGLMIERVKDRLRDFVRAEMACVPGAPSPEAVAAAMAAHGDGSVGTAPDDPADPPPDRHGDLLAYQVARVGSHPDMLAVVATLGIKCGSDSMLMLYRRTSAGWRELMVRRSRPYRKVKGGWQDLRFAVSPPDAQGRWFVATVSTTPWCTSAWQGMTYELARPGPMPERPNIFFRGKGTIYLGKEGDLVLKAERGAFEIRHDGGSLDSAILIRRHVRRYAVEGNGVRRVQPVAETVRDFVEEWIESEWSEAKGRSAAHPSLPTAHSTLKAARRKTLGSFASIRGCEGGLTQIEIADGAGPGWFFLVRGGAAGPWTLERTARRGASHCSGANRLEPTPR